jgi:1-acyl-sn-glycerol-3-phosphate acyltransferase
MLFRLYTVAAYYGSFAAFGAAAAGFNALCCLTGPAKTGARRQRWVRRGIQRVFLSLIRWLSVTRLVRVEYRGFAPGAAAGGRVLVANHPGLLDAVLLLARVPEGFCIFKPAVRRNPMLGPAAVRAGYLGSDHAIGLVRAATASLRAGATLVVFPEGTRTPAAGRPGVFKPGFALIARCARAPVQLVRISCDRELLTKGHAWWKPPPLPAHVVVEAGPLLDPNAAPSTAILVGDVEAWFRAAPAGPRAVFAESVAVARSAATLTAT